MGEGKETGNYYMGFRVWGTWGEGIKKSTLRQGFNSCVKGSGEPQQVGAFDLAQGPVGGRMEENGREHGNYTG